MRALQARIASYFKPFDGDNCPVKRDRRRIGKLQKEIAYLSSLFDPDRPTRHNPLGDYMNPAVQPTTQDTSAPPTFKASGVRPLSRLQAFRRKSQPQARAAKVSLLSRRPPWLPLQSALKRLALPRHSLAPWSSARKRSSTRSWQTGATGRPITPVARRECPSA